MRWRSRARTTPIAYLEKGGEVADRAIALAYFHQRADDVSHHVAKKRCGGDAIDDLAIAPLDAALEDSPHGIVGVAIGGLERAKVVLAVEQSRGIRHRRDLERG